MSAAALLRQLNVAGVALEVCDGKLRVNAPRGAITADLREQLARHKAAVLELLMVSVDDEGLPDVPCVCGGRSFWRPDRNVSWRCLACSPDAPGDGNRGGWISLPDPASPAILATSPIKGACSRCGQPVTWLGPLEGLRIWFSEIAHLHCPPPPAEMAPQPTPPEPPPASDDFDEAGYAAMRRDIITAVQDMAAEGRKVGWICRQLGLKSHEVYQILRGQYG